MLSMMMYNWITRQCFQEKKAIEKRTNDYLPTTALSSANSSTHSHNLACTSFAFSSNGLMFSGVIASFQSSPEEAEGEGMAGIVVENTGPRAGDKDMVGGEADRVGIVADAERRWSGMEWIEGGFIFETGFALRSALGSASEGGATSAGGPSLPEILDEGLEDADGKTGECG